MSDSTQKHLVDDDFVIIKLWPFSDEFDVLSQHPNSEIRTEFERIIADTHADCDQKTSWLRELAARAGAVQE